MTPEKLEKRFKRHVWYYIPLLTLQLATLYLAFLTAYDKGIFMTIIIFSTFLSVSWGILHHFLHHDLSSKVVLEYVLMGSLGITVAFMTIR